MTRDRRRIERPITAASGRGPSPRTTPEAEALGRRLADLSATTPTRFAATLADGFARLADPDTPRAATGRARRSGRCHGVRWPLHRGRHPRLPGRDEA